MEEILKDAAKSSPALVVMLILVIVFIKYLSQKDNALRAMFGEHIDERRESRRIIEDNTKALRDNAETRGHVTEALRQLKERL